MTVVAALASFAVVAGALTVVPGLDTALVLRAALTRGRGAAMATGAGISTGSLAWGAASAIGVSALLTASQAAFTALRVAGAAYLVWLGARLLRRGLARGPGSSEPGAIEPGPGSAGQHVSAVAAWRQGLATNLMNPKVGVFYVVMIPQFLPVGVPRVVMGLALAGIHVAEGTAWFALIILLASSARRWLVGDRVRRTIDGLTGTVLVAFGLRLVTTSR